MLRPAEGLFTSRAGGFFGNRGTGSPSIARGDAVGPDGKIYLICCPGWMLRLDAWANAGAFGKETGKY